MADSHSWRGPMGRSFRSRYRRYPARRLPTTSYRARSYSPSSASAAGRGRPRVATASGGALADVRSEARYSSGSWSRSQLWATPTIRRCRPLYFGLGIVICRRTGGDMPRRSAKGRFNISVAHEPVSTWNRRANSLPLVDATAPSICGRHCVVVMGMRFAPPAHPPSSAWPVCCDSGSVHAAHKSIDWEMSPASRR